MYQLWIGRDGYGASITIPNVGNFYLLFGADGLYVGAVEHEVKVAGSPLVISFDGSGVNLGDVYQAILAKLPK